MVDSVNKFNNTHLPVDHIPYENEHLVFIQQCITFHLPINRINSTIFLAIHNKKTFTSFEMVLFEIRKRCPRQYKHAVYPKL